MGYTRWDATSQSRRFLVDLLQTLFKRGDQLLLGFAYQRDDLIDQIGTRNFFAPGEIPRALDETVCRQADNELGPAFCAPVLDGQMPLDALLSAGARS